VNGYVVILNNFGMFPNRDNKLYADINVVKNELYDIEIKYAKMLGETTIKMYWETDSKDREIIPSRYLYNKLNS
jgi:hypothetical protein